MSGRPRIIWPRRAEWIERLVFAWRVLLLLLGATAAMAAGIGGIVAAMWLLRG